MQDKGVKILFRFYSDILEEETVETMWATVVDESKGLFRLDNIPFYAPLIASDDIVFAEYDENEMMLTYRETIEYSGNSTIRVVIMKDDIDVNNIRNLFKDRGCVSERVNNVYFAMEVLVSVNYLPIKKELEELENLEIIEYSEPCLSEIHRKQI